MGKSPNRKDLAYAMASLSNRITISDDDLAKINQCGIATTLDEKKTLEEFIDDYITGKKLEESACTREDQFRLLTTIKESAEKISEILSEYSSHENRRVAYRLDDTLPLALEENNFNIRSRYSIQLEETSKDFVHLEPDVLCPQSISDYMLILARASEMAIFNMHDENENDSGGRNPNEFYDHLLIKLDGYFNLMEGKRGTKDKFFHTVINKIPEEYRIEYDWNGIKKRLSRMNASKVTKPS